MTPKKLSPCTFFLKQLALFKHPGLSRRVLLYILMCSSFFTLMSTGVQLYTDYQRDLSDVHHHIDFIRDSYLAPLAVHAYNMDYDQMTLLLAGIFNLNDIVYLEISEPLDGGRQSLAVLGTLPEKRTICREFTLAYPSDPGGGPEHAFLMVAASLSSVYQRLWDKTLVILVSNAVKTFVAALCIFVIIQYVITQHLVRMVAYTRGLHMDRPAPPLILKDHKDLSGPENELDQLAGAITDLWDRVVRTGDTLRKNQALLNDTQRTAKIGGWEYDVDKKTRTWTDESYRIFGVSKEAYDPGDLTRNLDFFEPESRKTLADAYDKTLTTGLPYDLEVRLRSAGGRLLWVRTSARAEFRDNRVVRLYGTIMDITEMRQAETRYRLLADNVIDVIWTMDMDRRFTYVSPSVEPLTGFTPEEFMAAPLQNRFTQASFETAMIVYRQSTELEKKMGKGTVLKNRTLQLEIVRKDGTFVWTETKATFLREADGSLAGIIGVTRDISRRRQAETRLQQAQKLEAIGSLAGGIAHDFNNILSAIIGYAQLAIDRLPEDSPVQADLAQVYQAGERAKHLVVQILTFSRQQEHTAAPILISPIIKEALKFLKSTLPSSIDIREEIMADAGNVLADPTQIHQVLMNLCTNAAHAMDKTGGVLTVNLSGITLDQDAADTEADLVPGKYLRLTVGDTGHGIAPDILPKIFDPYFTTKKRGEGTGLGLATVHGIIKSCKGGITVSSIPGQGTTFHLYFPVIDTPAEPVTEKPVPAAGPTNGARILFVDDEPAIANLGKQLLENLGYRVESLVDPVTALALVKDDPARFDLVITDLTMPGMNGDRLAAELMTIRPDLPVILCSGFSMTLSKEEAAAAGINAFVMKPLLKNKLAAVIHQVLGDAHP
jgi:PAS domain S-box-containing protein